MNIILFDDPKLKVSLQPFSHTRPIARIRIGIYSIQKKWENITDQEVSFLTETYLQGKYPIHQKEENVLINGAVCPTPELWEEIKALPMGKALIKGVVIAVKYSGKVDVEKLFSQTLNNLNPQECVSNFTVIEKPYHIFLYNGQEIRKDLDLIKGKRESHKITDKFTAAYNEKDIFIEEGAKIRGAYLNAEGGPIYIGRNAEIMEGATIQGPTAICDGARVNMGARIWGDTTIGPYCKVGGEISNSVLFAYSNKAHSGYIGNTVIGEWCNMGADTNTSNLKNNYQEVRLWDYAEKELVDTGLQFCGLMMGDHSKCSINTMFNTGTLLGTFANVFGSDFPDKFVPSFTWGDSRTTYILEKAIDVAERVLARKNKTLSEEDKKIFKHIFESSEKFRRHR